MEIRYNSTEVIKILTLTNNTLKNLLNDDNWQVNLSMALFIKPKYIVVV